MISVPLFEQKTASLSLKNEGKGQKKVDEKWGNLTAGRSSQKTTDLHRSQTRFNRTQNILHKTERELTSANWHERNNPTNTNALTYVDWCQP